MFDLIKNNNSLRTFVFVLILMFLVFVNIGQNLTLIQTRYQMTQLEDEKERIRYEKNVLEETIEIYKTNYYIEEKARKDLGMVKSNEKPIKIVEHLDEKNENKHVLEANDKVSIYMGDWYLKLEEWYQSGMK